MAHPSEERPVAEGRSALERYIFGLTDEAKSTHQGMDHNQSMDEDTVPDKNTPSLPSLEDGLSSQDVSSSQDGFSSPIQRQTTPDLLSMAVQAHEAGDYQKAEHLYRKLLAERPKLASAWRNLGVLLRRRHMTEAAVVCLRRGLSLAPDNATGWSNLGNALWDLCRYEEAIRAHQYAIDLDPAAPRIHYNLGLVHRDSGQFKEAESCFRRAELLGYEHDDLRWECAFLDLLQGNLERGFEEMAACWQIHEYHPHFPEIPLCKDSATAGQVLLVYAENGIGDSIQFCRYLPLLRQQAQRILFYCDPSMVRLLQSSPEFEEIDLIGFDDQLPGAIDAVVPLSNVAHIVGRTSKNIPEETPYLTPPDDDVPIVDKGAVRQLHVGLVWSGDPGYKNNHHRSIPLAEFAKLLDLPGIQFYSFQMGDVKNQIQAHCFDPIIRDLSSHIRDFADTASLLRQFDLIISVDTAMAHLAGALDIPVWVLLHFAPDWRWQMGRSDSPWYKSMSLLRQTSPGDWQEVIYHVRRRLIDKLHALEQG